MPSAKVYRFPGGARRRPFPPRPPEQVCYLIRPPSPIRSGVFCPLLCVTLLAAFLYLSEAVRVERHDRLYTALLVAVWSLSFTSKALLRTRVLGPILVRTGQMVVAGGVASFFGFLYWLVLTHS